MRGAQIWPTGLPCTEQSDVDPSVILVTQLGSNKSSKNKWEFILCQEPRVQLGASLSPLWQLSAEDGMVTPLQVKHLRLRGLTQQVTVKDRIQTQVFPPPPQSSWGLSVTPSMRLAAKCDPHVCTPYARDINSESSFS